MKIQIPDDGSFARPSGKELDAPDIAITGVSAPATEIQCAGQNIEDGVSVIMPAFRAAGVIEAALRSVQTQSYSNWEVLVADDCSPDHTAEIVASISAKDSRIKLIKLNINAGPAAARNAALSQSRGRWIAFLDSDDLWLPNKLANCLKFAADKNAGFIYTGYRRISADGTLEGRHITVPESMDYRSLLGNTAIATSTVMLDRDKIGPVAMTDTYYDDWDCWLGILKTGHRAYGLNDDLMRYRVLAGSVSRNKLRSALRVLNAYRNLEKLSMARSLWYFAQYSYRGWLKYRRF